MANLNEWVYRRVVCWCGVNEPRCPRPGRSRWWRPAPTRVCRSPGPGRAGRGRGSSGQPGARFQHNDVFMKLLLQPVQRRRAGRLPWRPGAVLAGAFSSPGLGWAGLGWAGLAAGPREYGCWCWCGVAVGWAAAAVSRARLHHGAAAAGRQPRRLHLVLRPRPAPPPAPPSEQ